MSETREIETFMWEEQPGEPKKKPKKKPAKKAAASEDVLEDDSASSGPGLFDQIKGLIDPLSARMEKMEGKVNRLTRADDDDDDDDTEA